MGNLLERAAWPLAYVIVVVIPVAVALLVGLLGVWSPLAPLLLIAAGVGYIVLAARIALEMMARQAADAASRGATKAESAERLLADKPFAAFMPFLYVGGFPLILIGLVWLAFVDLLLFAIVLAIGIAAILWWKRWARLRRDTPTD